MALKITHIRLNKTRPQADQLRVVLWADVTCNDREEFLKLLRKTTEKAAEVKKFVVTHDKGYTDRDLNRVRRRNNLASLEAAIAFVYAGLEASGQLYRDQLKQDWQVHVVDSIRLESTNEQAQPMSKVLPSKLLQNRPKRSTTVSIV